MITKTGAQRGAESRWSRNKSDDWRLQLDDWRV